MDPAGGDVLAIEAFISRMSAEGPSANRPPQMALES
jgi:hypothetical protein